MKRGIDISQWNPVTNWSAVKKDVDFVIIRAGYGLNTVDKTFVSKIEGAIAVGLNIGIYWFSYALNDAQAKQEAQFCKKTVAKYKKHINMPIYFDYEYDSMDYANKHGIYPNKQSVTNLCKAFCAEISKEYKAGVYANLDYFNRFIDKGQLNGYSLWYANWSVRSVTGYDIWQYSSNGTVNGISGRVDMNYLLNESIINGKPTPQPTPTPAPTPKPTGVTFTYAVKVQGGQILPAVKNLEDYAGVQGKKITDIAIKCNKGNLRYRVHVLGGGWLPWVTGYNWKDAKNGYAGNGKVIDCVQVELTGVAGQVAQYRVSPVRKNYYDWQYNTQKTGGQDGYAGSYGVAIDRFQVF